MKVYYGDNFSGHTKYARPLQEIKVNQEFVWEDLSGFIPAVYIGNKGIVTDFCVRVSNEAVQQFLDKWEQTLERHPEKEELSQLAEENPLSVNFHVKITVNGQELKSDFGCGTGYSRIIMEKYRGKKKYRSIEEELAQEYGCDNHTSWYFLRHQCRWKKKPDRLKSLEIDFIAERKSYVAEKMEIALQCGQEVYKVHHPLTGQTYDLKIFETEQGTLNQNIWESMKECHPQLEYPARYAALSYEIIPNLSEEVFRMEACDNGDQPRGLLENQAAGAVVVGGEDSTVIGHADGPTSVFIAGKMTDKKKRAAMSGLYFDLPEKLWWKAVFLEKERKDMRLCIEF